MTATLSTRLTIPSLGPGEVELSVDYTYSRSTRELFLDNCFADIDGTEIDVWSRLTQDQRAVLEERCVADYYDRMTALREDTVRERSEETVWG